MKMSRLENWRLELRKSGVCECRDKYTCRTMSSLQIKESIYSALSSGRVVVERAYGWSESKRSQIRLKSFFVFFFDTKDVLNIKAYKA